MLGRRFSCSWLERARYLQGVPDGDALDAALDFVTVDVRLGGALPNRVFLAVLLAHVEFPARFGLGEGMPSCPS